ncbi:hypothetical protein [Hansschlegelia zhihuaiae]|uniref:Uncharacterized protein n=1 Tax=Hansschlegelia zhihuaiae TaxID=405005 RepID=A0A4Q0M4U7_9HYPH|nr:hypothetical protein [Hansschlegelia zhihuaiae]RXF67676.1 hypothetical protein EK403_20955 [Hansschlegelia zhihuaiae]
MRYEPPVGAANPDASYLPRNVSGGGSTGSRVPAKAIEAPMREIVAAIQSAGITPSAGNLGQLAQAIVVKAQGALADFLDASPSAMAALEALRDALAADEDLGAAMLAAIGTRATQDALDFEKGRIDGMLAGAPADLKTFLAVSLRLAEMDAEIAAEAFRAITPVTLVAVELYETVQDGERDRFVVAYPPGADITANFGRHIEIIVPEGVTNSLGQPRLVAQGDDDHREMKTHDGSVVPKNAIGPGCYILSGQGDYWAFQSGALQSAAVMTALGRLEASAEEALGMRGAIAALQAGSADRVGPGRWFYSGVWTGPAELRPQLAAGYVTNDAELGRVLLVRGAVDSVLVEGERRCDVVRGANAPVRPTRLYQIPEMSFRRHKDPSAGEEPVEIRIQFSAADWTDLGNVRAGPVFSPSAGQAAERVTVFLAFEADLLPEGEIGVVIPEGTAFVDHGFRLIGATHETALGTATELIDVTGGVSGGVDVVSVTSRVYALETGRATKNLENLTDADGARRKLKAAPEIRSDGYYLTDNHEWVHDPSGADVNTASWQAALTYCIENDVKRLVVPPGKAILRPPAAKTFTFTTGADRNVHSCGHLSRVDGDGKQIPFELEIYGGGTHLLMAPPTSLVGTTHQADHNFFLSTPVIENDDGELSILKGRKIKLKGFVFDGDTAYWTAGRILSAGYWQGNEEVEYEDILVTCTHGTEMRGGNFQGNGRALLRKLSLRDAVQAFWAQFNREVIVKDFYAENFIEALDFDERNDVVRIDGAVFRDSNQSQPTYAGQCIDMTSPGFAILENIDAKNVGAIMYLYGKDKSYRTFEEFRNAAGVAAGAGQRINSENVTLRNFHGEDIGHFDAGNQHAIMISNPRAAGDSITPVTRNVTLEGGYLKNTGCVRVNECDDLKIKSLEMFDTIVPVTFGDTGQAGAALSLSGAIADGVARANGVLTGAIEDVRVTRALRGAVAIDSALELRGRGLTIEDHNTENASTKIGLDIRGLNRLQGTMVDLDHVRCKSQYANAADLRVQGDGNSGYGSLRLGTNVRLGSATRVIRGGADPLKKQATTGRRARVASQPQGGTFPLAVNAIVFDDEHALLDRISLNVLASLAGDATNYWNLRFYRVRAGINTQIGITYPIGNVATTAQTVIDLTVANLNAVATFQPGDLLMAYITKNNAPAYAFPEVELQLRLFAGAAI